MEISFTGAPEYMATTVGFGKASWNIFSSFRRLGLDPTVKNDKAPIGISFCPPHDYTFYEGQYKIGYTPWESTGYFNGWLEKAAECDEIWTTSKWNKMIFENMFNREVFVYTHGIDHNFSPRKRKYDSNAPFTFLHIGEPFNRKDGQLVVDTFIRLYGNDPRYHLIMKCTGSNNLWITPPGGGDQVKPDKLYNNITIYDEVFYASEMLALYSAAHCFIYPSWGEGFGFNPLQAMGMGIPTICTAEWAEYKNRITLPLSSTISESPWQTVHPGQQLKPNAEELELLMLDVVQNYSKYSDIAFKNAFILHKEYDWDLVSRPAVGRLKKIQKSRF
jgi:glycosyltransferase involved in cell wall biosynthesis